MQGMSMLCALAMDYAGSSAGTASCAFAERCGRQTPPESRPAAALHEADISFSGA